MAVSAKRRVGGVVQKAVPEKRGRVRVGGTNAELVFRKTLGMVLTAMRESRKMRMQDVSGQCGIHQPQLSVLESGKVRVRLDTLMRLARVYGVPVTAIIEETMRESESGGDRRTN